MPKTKTRKAVAKRFRVTKNGKVIRRNASTRHILTKKTRKKKRQLRHSSVAHPTDAKRIASMISAG